MVVADWSQPFITALAKAYRLTEARDRPPKRKEKKVGRPAIGKARKVVIPGDVMTDLRLIAAMNGEPVSDVIRAALRHYVRHALKGRRAA